MIIWYTGFCYWIPPVTFHTSCSLDYTYWPWDVQRCEIVLGSWTKTGTELDVANGDGRNVSGCVNS